MSNQPFPGAFLDAIKEKCNLPEYSVSKAVVILNLEKNKIQRREFHTVMKGNGDVFTDSSTLDFCEIYEPVEGLQGREEGLELENTSSDEDQEEVQDSHKCGGCGEAYATLDLFVKHKIVCNSRKKTTKNRMAILRFDRHSFKVECDDRYEINLNAEQRDDGLKCIKGITIVAEQPAEQIEELAEQSKGLAETYKKPIELEQEKRNKLAEMNKKLIELEQEQSNPVPKHIRSQTQSMDHFLSPFII